MNLSLYLDGDSILHRAPAGAKLLALALIAVAVSLLPITWWTAGVCLALPVLGYLIARIPLRQLWLNLRQLVFLLAFLLVTQLIFLDVVHAAANTSRVIGLVLLAGLLTHTTRVSVMVETVVRLLTPLTRIPGARRVGLGPHVPEKIGLALALAITSVGHLSAVISQVRLAQRSRGVKLSVWRFGSAWVVPVLVLTLKHADDVGDALVARGLD
ncbi:energy-coupling factor transporter transmembrane component T family protein [Citricoccus muralis]|uniref:Energy-coupling factor transporter transmembrane protein EcfT n=1 Tax=Citricoccus muralis TaxID=169134 RepID=A0ABY8H5G8_9MICC|nr:energy-coupling factor transporter transmembrane protein EcfT [Citricoccus muralis]WFP16386.1 energy-coupling factor transporter transmembrane protein EcfT [Citricoccus muralis]